MMSLSPRELYRRECTAIAETDKRWNKTSSGDDCTVCGSFTHWKLKEKYKCPGCHSWLTDTEADTLPLLAPPVYLRPLGDGAFVRCENCGDHRLPKYNWQWAGNGKVKKLALGALCANCERWVRWVDPITYGPYAPPKPPVKLEPEEEYLFEDVIEETKHKGYIDTSAGDVLKKSTKAPLPPPPANKAISPLERSMMCVQLYEKGSRLYLNQKGEVCCTSWARVPDTIHYGLKSCALRLKYAMIEDIYWQLRASEVTPHIVYIHPKDRVRTARFKAWQNGDRKYLRDGAPELSINEVVAMEVESLGFSPTLRALDKYERCEDHEEAVPVLTKQEGLF